MQAMLPEDFPFFGLILLNEAFMYHLAVLFLFKFQRCNYKIEETDYLLY